MVQIATSKIIALEMSIIFLLKCKNDIDERTIAALQIHRLQETYNNNDFDSEKTETSLMM